MIEYIRKDITTITQGVIAHGVNCQATMGAGVALALMKKWPSIRESYMRYKPGPQNLGNVDFVDVDPKNELISFDDDEREGLSLVVANCWTQEFCGPGDKKYADVDAIIKCMANVYSYADAHDLNVAIPLIGCGLAGLSWADDVQPIIDECDEAFPRIDTTVCIWG